MPGTLRLPRRAALLGGAAGALAAPRLVFGQGTAPARIAAEAERPRADWGAAVGDVGADRALVWSRADRPARLVVEWATDEGFRNAERVRGPHATEATDFTARVDLQGLPADAEIFYRVIFEGLDSDRAAAAPVLGRFRTAPASRRDVRFLWSGDTAGQGWGIDESRGGMRIYETMRRTGADFFIHCGDTVYADGPIAPEVRLPDGSTWRNLVIPEVAKVAETLAEFRGRYRYNLMDRNVRAFHAEVPQVWLWDDHEVTNNWSDAKDLSADARYTEKRVALLAARATRAFLDYAPLRPHGADEAERVYRRIAYGPHLDVFALDMRSYRGPNSHNRQERAGLETAILGAAQVRWLLRGLLASTATWKVIACDMPLGLVVGDGRDAEGRPRFEAVANGNGPALGRELEIAGLLSALRHAGVRNVVWVTADVHYTAAHRYDPGRARYRDFHPFWEFVSGPLHAGGFGPNEADDTFGLEVVWQRAPEGRANVPPTEGMLFFGEMAIEGRSGVLTVMLKDVAGATLWRRSFEPERA
ncbi:alkaline phosphatase D family protein [Caldovatus aquaticus]|uniref:Alkaline phosphatase D family protein n=1 Tax=Caldovatus aquaticus TaxID=2865671 RepID=A0ABS7F4Z1_9PROT|nr:alkaline phosphatase D family protein [Caldovatus aquaticus]MBW8270695.1 alkaline phosphatase D family protein [Caldovatus aquaticus]